MATIILGNGFKRSVAAGMLIMVQPFRAAFGLMVTTMKTQKSAIEYWSSHASGVMSELVETLDIFFDKNIFAKVGFLGADWHGNAHEQPPEVEKDKQLAGVLYGFLVQMLAHRLIGELNASHTLPNKTAMLANGDAVVVRRGLSELKHWWDKLCHFERLASTSKLVADLLHDLEWPRLHWLRLVLVCLAEADFASIPPHVLSKLLGLWRGITSTKAIEDLIRICGTWRG